MSTRCVVLTGGVGGAKLALGMSRLIAGPDLAIVANTGDDFRHLGLAISPDLDTLMYTLAGVVNPDTGWGCRDESWNFIEAMAQLGGETWFRLGDRDLATHLLRTPALERGQSLTQITADLCRRFGVDSRLLPVSDSAIATCIHSGSEVLPFQEYFVKLRCEPPVTRLEYRGAANALPTDAVLSALADPDLQAIVIAPSNPWLSIDPILAVPGMIDALRASAAPVIAVSPLIAGAAIKGPTAKIMAELGLDSSATEVARHYQPVADGFILDSTDQALADAIRGLPIAVRTCNTLMHHLEDKIELAKQALDFAAMLRSQSR